MRRRLVSTRSVRAIIRHVTDGDALVRKAVLGMMAVKRMSMLTHASLEKKLSSRAQELAKDLNRYIQDSELVSISFSLRVR